MAGVMDQMPLGVLIFHVMTVMMVTVQMIVVTVKAVMELWMTAANVMVTVHPVLTVLEYQMVILLKTVLVLV